MLPLNMIPDNPILGIPANFRFAVLFLESGIWPLPEVRFQRVSGLSTRLDIRTVNEGGQNRYSHRLPQRVQSDTLVLERGLEVVSILNMSVDEQFATMQINPASIMVMLFSEQRLFGAPLPMEAWMFYRAFPVRWSTADLDANNPQVLIDTLEFAYSDMRRMTTSFARAGAGLAAR